MLVRLIIMVCVSLFTACGGGGASGNPTPGGTTSTTVSSVAPAGLIDISADGYSPGTSHSSSYCANGGTYPNQWEWNPLTKRTNPTAATSGTPLVKHIRGGIVIATYNKLSGYRSAPNNIDAHDTSVGPFRRAPYTQWQDGDIFEIYPAIYEGEDQQIFIGPNFANDAAYTAGVYTTPKNITIRGITVGGVRPLIRTPGTGASNANFGQAPIYVGTSENITIENIDVDYVAGSGYIGKAGIYVNGAKNLTLRNVRVAGFRRTNQNGIFGTPANSGTLLLENVELYDNGGNNGPEHNAYINASATDNNFTFKVIGSWSHGAWYGHLLKSRAQITVIEGSYLSGTRAGAGAQTETYLLDVPDGGTLIARNNIFVKNYSGDNSNAMSLTFGIEGNLATYDMSRPWEVLIEHNTFVGFAREYETSGVYQRWLYPMYIKSDTPGTKTVQHNLFVGYCDTGTTTKDFRGTNSVTLNFNQIDAGFRPRSPIATGNPGIVNFMQYAHEARSALRSTAQVGARD